MSNFYKMADELRKELADLYPDGYIKTTRNGRTEKTIIRNYSGKPIKGIQIAMIEADGTETDLTQFVRSYEVTRKKIVTATKIRK